MQRLPTTSQQQQLDNVVSWVWCKKSSYCWSLIAELLLCYISFFCAKVEIPWKKYKMSDDALQNWKSEMVHNWPLNSSIKSNVSLSIFNILHSQWWITCPLLRESSSTQPPLVDYWYSILLSIHKYIFFFPSEKIKLSREGSSQATTMSENYFKRWRIHAFPFSMH